MLNHTILHILIGLLLLSSFNVLRAQATEKVIYKKYVLKDSGLIHKSAVILFYTDSTFINFGILDNKKELDLFVWYKAGTWILKNNKPECMANEKVMPEEDLKKLVKTFYRRHKDRVLIESYYEFVHESYRNGTLTVSDEQVSDNDKKINYYEPAL